jgi:hypothetical protein
MITTVGKAKEKRCPMSMGRNERPGDLNCQATQCMAWEFYVPPADPEHDEHAPVPDLDKRGYCGMSAARVAKSHPDTRRSITVLEL